MKKLHVIVTVLIATILLGFSPRPTAVASSPQTLALAAPALADLNTQDAVAATIGQRLDEEAGISAYYKSPDPINLSQVRPMFRTIETETADYIIGSMGIPNYAEEHFDAHVYVHKSGWILAYYLRDDPISKIIDARAFTIDTTKLNNVVAAVASTIGAPFTSATHYDFRYPNATNMMLIAENVENGNTFTIQMPTTYGYFERGWALRDVGCCAFGSFRLNGASLGHIWNEGGTKYGVITASELTPGVTHNIEVHEYGFLIIMYRVP